MKRQPKDPFNGAGDFEPKKPDVKTKAAKQSPKKTKVSAKPSPATAQTVLTDILSTAEGAIARMHLIDLEAAAQDFEYIIQLAKDGLKAVQA